MRIIILIISIFIIFTSATSHAETLAGQELQFPKEIEEYSKLYHEIEDSGTRQSLEQLLKQGELAKKVFLEVNKNFYPFGNFVKQPNQQHIDFNKNVDDKIPGYKVSADIDPMYYDIDPKKYFQLARKSGTEEDLKFFSLYFMSFPVASNWPSYIEVHSDVDFCLKRGVPEYEIFIPAWSDFIKYSQSEYYKSLAKIYMKDFEEMQNLDDCNYRNTD